ncbi:uncharacterized protein LOC111612466, partial [Centruroides sculpturatus]|uniref:uncharacterized protein LOC111612466 n=1 Tax=Centruroides sculpturatus TaxID=218467 RepID=UPI000C6D4772
SESADGSGISESNLKQNIHPVLNSEKDVLDDNEPEVRECIIKSTTFSDIFDESNDTEEYSDKSDQEIELNVPLSPAETTSSVYKEYKKRPLLRDFSELERNSLVSEVIYEEEEPESGDDGSESDGSFHSDTIFIDYEECDVNISTTDVSDNCNTENNASVITEEEKSVADLSHLAEKSNSLISSAEQKNLNVPLSPEEITSSIYEEYKKRPLLRDFSELERNSLVSEVIYEEEEPESGDDGSESDGSFHSDTIFIDYEECDVNISTTDVSDNCNTENNASVITEEEKSVADLSHLAEKSNSLISSAEQKNLNVPLSPEEITSSIYEEYKKRPLLRDFIELERYSLVSEVIYEEEEPESGDDGSENDGSIHSDTIIDYEKCDVNISGTDLLNQCHIENNESIIAEEEKYVADVSQLVEKSQSLTSLDVKLCNSNLSIDETPNVSNEFYRWNTFSNGFEEVENQNKVNKEILQSNFDIVKHLQLDKNYAEGAIEVEKVVDVDYSSLPEEELSAKSKKEEERNCASLFLYYFRRLSSLLFSCTKSKK